ncbi:hypothetical protein GCM10010971_37300 [Silvimonas amylolytica]|uniref:Uncharacterized protein n=1 Tax=Silvimonas amylolytica TaxID=449663 RepID=A0ABQ2PR89_9NEIS|nr:hypothetical protein GCM10010971_37300 [Silvimonas amylolytica]
MAGCLVAVSVFTGLCAPAADAVTLAPSERQKINLGETPWKYIKDQDPATAMQTGFDDSSWLSVGIPYSANQLDTFINTESGGGEGDLDGTKNWYRKHFTLDASNSGRKVLVEFEGAHTGVQVYVNGTFIPGTSAINPQATHVVGFIPFMVDITPYVKFDGSDNVLAVKVAKGDTFFESPGFSQAFRFGQSDAGLFRPVYMYITDKVHIPLNVYAGQNTWGTYVATVSATDAQATIDVQTNVLNEGTTAQPVTLTTQIVDAAGNVVASAQAQKTISPNGTGALQPTLFDQTLTVNNPTLWYPNNSPYGKPYMYKVFHTVSINGVVVDSVQSPLGIRTITWDKDLPSINGHRMFLWGGSSRYDYPALGTSVPEEQQWRDLKLMADAGGNLWRPGHSTSSPEFVDAADALGIFIIQPSGDGENGFANACTTPPCDMQTLKTELHRDMIVRDRSHPSILAWEADNGATDTTFAQSLKALSKVWDPINTRAQSDRTPNPANGDILGCTMEGCEVLTKQTYPGSPAWGAEYWGAGTARQAWDYELAFAAPFLDNWRKGVAINAFGMAQWYFADSPGESSTYVEGTTGPGVRSLGASMVDMNRFPKLLYYVYQAAWTPYSIKPVVKLAHHWNRSGNIQVNAFSNCPSVRLLINGTAQGSDQTPNPWNSDSSANLTQSTTKMPFQVHWNVNWVAGTATAQCLDQFGAVQATDTLTTAGAENRILLTMVPELTKPDGTTFAVTANGSDAAFVVAKVVDAQGNLVPTAADNINFTVSGPATYMGGSEQYVTAGQPLTYHSPGDPQLQVEGGMTKIALRSQFTAGSVTITATAPGLQTGTVSYTIQAVSHPTPPASAPSIIAQPVSTSVTSGQPALFSVTASGAAPLTFQWYKNGTAISGANGASYSTPATGSGDNGASYTVTVTNSLGNVTSSAATVTVVAAAAPVIQTAPAAQNVDAGQTATFSVAATGSPTLQYQWLKNGTAINGATNTSYTTPVLTTANNGEMYSVKVTNPVNTVTSAAVSLTVNAARVPAITTQPNNITGIPGQPVTFTVAVSGSSPFHYQWQKNGTNVGTDSATFTIPTVQNTDAGNYTVTVTNVAGSVTSNVATLTMAPPGVNLALGKVTAASSYENQQGNPASNVVDGSTTTKWGSAFVDPSWISIDFGAVTAFNRIILRWEAAYAVAYQIQVSNDNANWTTVYTQTAGTGGNEDFSFPTARARYVRMYGTQRGTQYGYSLYEFEVYNVANCGDANERYTIVDTANVHDNQTGLTWKRAQYTYTTQGAQFTQQVAAGYCASQNTRLPTKDEALAISGANAASCAFPSPWNTWTSTNQDSTYSYWVSSAGNASVAVANNFPGWALCTSGTSAPAPTITTQPANQSVTAGQTATFSVVANGSGTLSYQWMKNGSAVATTTTGSYTTPATTSTDNGAVYSVVITSSQGGSVTSANATLTVNGGSGGGGTTINLALNKPATASGYENQTVEPASAAFDGSTTTRWSSAFVDPGWIAVDLGSAKTFDHVILRWETAYATAYQIQVSNDNTNWTTVYTQSAGVGGVEDFHFTAATARYVRMYGTARATQYGYSLWEFEIYSTAAPTITTQPANQSVSAGQTATFSVVATGSSLSYQWQKNGANIAGATTASYTTPATASADSGAVFTVIISDTNGNSLTSSAATLTVGSSGSGGSGGTGGSGSNPGTNLALGKTATISSNENPAFSQAAFVTDGDLTTRWSSASADPQWVQIDLGSTQSIGRVILYWEAAYGKVYQIQVSNDAQNWTTAYTQSNGQGGTEDISFATVSGRYIRMYGTQRGTQYGYSLYEFQVYATQAAGGNTPAVTTQPASQAVTVGATAQFSVTATGTAPLTYKWYKNGAVITGATSASYTTPATTAADSGATFDVVVTNGSGSATSANAVLTVNSAAGANLAAAAVTANASTAAPSYTVYPGFVGIDLQNNTRGAWADNQIYVAVIGRDPATGQFAWVSPDGTITDAKVSDNTAANHLSKNGQNYSNYFFTLAQAKLLKLPKMDSGRVFVSLGGPMYITILSDVNGNVGFAGPNPLNPTDPNINVYYDWYEFTYNDTGLWINTTQVDEFGIPLMVDVWGANATFHMQTGTGEPVASIYNEFVNETPAAFHLTQPALPRILAPGKSSFDVGQPNANYFDAYVTQIWNQYTTNTLTVDMWGGSRRFAGKVQGNTMVFTEVNLNNGAYVGGTYNVSKPTTQDILEGKGTLATGNSTELALEAQICAAFNRHIMEDVTKWSTPSAWYQSAPANYYAQFWHNHSVGGLAYGFAYDDVSNQSSTIMSPTPEHAAFGIYW